MPRISLAYARSKGILRGIGGLRSQEADSERGNENQPFVQVHLETDETRNRKQEHDHVCDDVENTSDLV